MTTIYVWEGVGRQLWTRDTAGNQSFSCYSLFAELVIAGKPFPGMRKLCSLQIDADQLIPLFQQHSRDDGETYWKLDYQVVVHYNGTCLTAKIHWSDEVWHLNPNLRYTDSLQGRVYNGPVTVIPGHEY